MARRIVLIACIAAGILLAGVLLLHAPWTRARVAGWLIARAERDYGIDISLKSLEYNLAALRVRARGISAAARAHGEVPFFTADEVAIDVPWALLAGRAIAIESVRMVRPRVSIVRFPDGSLNLPAARPATAGPAPVIDVESFAIEDLACSYTDVQEAFEIDLAGVSAGLAHGDERRTTGRLTVRKGPRVRFGEREIAATRLTAALAFDGRTLTFQDLALAMPGVQLAARGQIDQIFGAPALDARASAQVDVDALSGLLWSDNVPTPKGALRVDAALRGPVANPTARVAVEGPWLTWADPARTGRRALRLDTIRARASVTRDAVTIESFSAGLPGGAITGSLRWGFADANLREAAFVLHHRASRGPSMLGILLDGRATFRLERGGWRLDHRHRVADAAELVGHVRGRLSTPLADSPIDGRAHLRVRDAETLAARLFEVPRIFRGRAQGSFDLSGTVGDPRVRGGIEAEGMTGAGGLVLSARLNATLGELAVTTFTAIAGPNRVEGAAALRFAGQALRGGFTADVSDLAALGAIAPIDDIWKPGGALRLKGALGGTLEAPALSIEADGELAIGGRTLGPLQATFAVVKTDARLGLALPSFGATAEGQLALVQPYRFTASATARSIALDRLPVGPAHAMGLEGTIGVTTRVSGTLARLGDVTAEVDIAPFEATVRGIGVRSASPASLRYAPPDVEISGVRLLTGATSLQVDGRVGSEEAPLRARLAGDLRDLMPFLVAGGRRAPGGEQARGRIELDAAVRGSIRRPAIEATLAVSSARVSSSTLPPASGVDLRISYRDGVARIEQTGATWQGARLAASGSVPARLLEAWLPAALVAALPPGPQTATLDIRLDDVTEEVLAPWIRAETRQSITGRASAAARLEATGLTLADVRGTITVDRADVQLAGLAFGQRQPTRWTLAGGRLTFAQFDWGLADRTEHRVAVSGSVALSPVAFDLRVKGLTDLRAAAAFVPDLGPSGSAALDVALAGTPDAPRLQGRVEVAGGGATIAGLDLAVTELDGTIRLTDTRLTAERLRGRANGGTLEIQGDVDLASLLGAGRSPRAPQPAGLLAITGRGMAFNVPAGLQSEVDADLQIHVMNAQPRVTGTVTVVRSQYRRPMSLVAGLFAAAGMRATTPGAEARPAGTTALLDLRIQTAEDLLVDNNYGRFEVGASLRLGGMIARPTLTGRAELREGGEIFAGGIPYHIDRGVVDFTNPNVIEPTLDIAARTRVGAYEITLTVAGTPETLRTELTADDPTLDRADIVSLLLTGRTLEGVSEQEARLVGQQVLSLASGELLGFAGRAVRLDVLRIERGIVSELGDLGDVAAQVDPAARLTLAKNLSPEARVLYSQNLTRGSDLLWIVTYQALRDFEFRGVFDSDQDRVYEARHQLNFGGPSQPGPPAGERQRAKAEALARVSTIRIAGEPGVPEQDLRDRLRVTEGDRFDPVEWRRDRERLLRFYRERGFLEARVTATRRSSPGRRVGEDLTLSYDIEPGPRCELQIEGAVLRPDTVQSIRTAWTEAVFDRFFQDEAVRLARADLVDHGYLQAAIEARFERVEPGVKRFTLSIAPGPRSDDRRIEFDGNRHFTDEALLGMTEAAGFTRAAWLDRGSFERYLTDQYRAAGFLAAAVRVGPPRFEPLTAVLPVTVDEDSRFHMASIVLEGVDSGRDRDVRDAAGVAIGDPFRAGIADEARRAIELWYRQRGFNAVRVSVTPVIDKAAKHVTLHVSVAEGLQQIVAGIEVRGLHHTRPSVVERAAEFERGAPVNLADWQQSRKRLYDTGLFRRVEIEPAPGAAAAGPGEPVIARVTVEERPRWRLRYGVQLQDDHAPAADQARFSPGLVTDVQDRNLLGRAATSGVSLRHERDRTLARGFLTVPRLLGLPATSSLFVARSRETPRAGRVINSTSVTGEQRIRPLGAWKISYSYAFKRNHTVDTSFPFDAANPFDITVNVARLIATALADTRDDPFDARGGWFHASTVEYAADQIGSDLRFLKFNAQQAYFRQAGPVVVASAARLGLGRGFGGQEFPSLEYFFAGGGTTVRGYAEDAIAVDALGFPRGGAASLVLNQEVRFPATGRVRGVGFVDAGNIFPRAADLSLAGLKIGIGAGARVSTPVGLLRVDFGIPLASGQPRRPRWYFSVGQMF